MNKKYNPFLDSVAVIAVILIPVFGLACNYNSNTPFGATESPSNTNRVKLQASEIYEKNHKSVLVVLAYNKDGMAIAQGSGFIVRGDGAIVTNLHVVSEAVSIQVKTAQDKYLEVEGVLYNDEANDLIVLKVRGDDLPMINLGDSDKVKPGERVYVIGNPEGLENTISDGLVSGIREISEKRKVIQISAPVSQGSSGGPVFNEYGEVIGVATLILKDAQNLNFAMPINSIKDKISNQRVVVLKGTGITDYKKTWEYWFCLGYSLKEAKQYNEAIDAFKQAIQINPNVAELYFIIGYTYDDINDYLKAIECYKEAVRLKPDYAEAYCNLGFSYGKNGDYQKEIECCKEAIRIRPDDAEAHYNIGIAYEKTGNHQKAIEFYKEAVRLKPDYSEAYCDLGAAYGNMGNNQNEIECYREAIRLKPDFAEAYYNLAIAYGDIGDNQKGMEYFKDAIRIRSNYAEAHFGLGVTYVKTGDYQKAIECYKESIKIKSDLADAHYGLGIAYLRTNQRSSALDEYKILKEMDKELADKLLEFINK